MNKAKLSKTMNKAKLSKSNSRRQTLMDMMSGSVEAKSVCPVPFGGVKEVGFFGLQIGLVDLALTLLEIVFEIFHLLYVKLLFVPGHYLFVSAVLVLFVYFLELFQLLTQVAHAAATVVLDTFGALAFGFVVEGRLGELSQRFYLYLTCFYALAASLVGFGFGVRARGFVGRVCYFLLELDLVLDILLD